MFYHVIEHKTVIIRHCISIAASWHNADKNQPLYPIYVRPQRHATEKWVVKFMI